MVWPRPMSGEVSLEAISDSAMADDVATGPVCEVHSNPFALSSSTALPKAIQTRLKPKDNSRKRFRCDVTTELDVLRNSKIETALAQLIEKLVTTMEAMAEKVDAQHQEIAELTRALKQAQPNQQLKQQQLQFCPIPPIYVNQRIPSANEVPKERTWAHIVCQGNGQPTVATPHQPTVGKNQPKKMVGNKKDSITFSQVQPQPHMPVEVTPNSLLMKQLTLPEARPARNIEAVPIRIEKTLPRNQCPAKEWRAALKAKDIKPYTILFPYRTAVEILIPKADVEKMQNFLGEIKRSPADVNPFLRRDGQPGPLSQESIQRTIEQRIAMLKFETSLVGVKYLQESIAQGLTSLQNIDTMERLQRNCEAILKEKRLQHPTQQQRSNVTTQSSATQAH